MLAGLGPTAIAEGLGYDKSTISRDIKALCKEWQKEATHVVQTAKTIELRRIERAINAIWEEVTKGNMAAIDRYDKLGRRKDNLLGMNSAQKVELTGADGSAIKVEGFNAALKKVYGTKDEQVKTDEDGDDDES